MTAQQLINQALRRIGELASGESPSTEESDDGLVALNQILANWSAQQVPVIGISRRTFTLTGAALYTIGSGGTINVTRPLRIKSALVSANGIETDFEVVSAEVWAQAKQNRALFYDGAYPLGTIRLRPAPSGGTLELYNYEPISSLASLATAIDLPPGYERALVYALAMDLAPEYGRQIPPEVAAVAQEAMGAIASLNKQVLAEPTPPPPPAQAA